MAHSTIHLGSTPAGAPKACSASTKGIAILFELALSTLLASWWAIVAGGLCAILLILRAALEDRTLRAELPGYAAYARQVRYRLVPGVW